MYVPKAMRSVAKVFYCKYRFEFGYLFERSATMLEDRVLAETVYSCLQDTCLFRYSPMGRIEEAGDFVSLV